MKNKMRKENLSKKSSAIIGREIIGRIMLLLILAAIIPANALADSPPMPHSISGTVFLADGTTQAPAGTSFSINDTISSDFITGTTAGTPPLFTNTGYYGAIINGNDGDNVVVRAWTSNYYGQTVVVLSGTMSNVNVVMNIPISDTVPPIISNVHTGTITNESASILWNTDENSNSTVYYGSSPSLGSKVSNSASVTSHSLGLTGLMNNTLYYYKVESCDSSKNCAESDVKQFTTQQNYASEWNDDTNPNYIRGTIKFNGVAAPSGTSYTVTVTAGTNAGFTYSGSVDDSKVPSFLYNHGYYSTGDLVEFSTGDTFRVNVVGCSNYATGTFVTGGNGGFGTGSVDIECAIDMTPPVITNVRVESITNQSGIVKWNTDDSSTSIVNYGTTVSLGSEASDPTLVTTHTIQLNGLQELTLYYFKVRSCNSDNYCSESSIGNFTTLLTVKDEDHDGYNNTVDCNDHNPAIHPGAPEVCNGVDDNCNSVIDEEGALGCTVYYYDNDGDNFGTTDSKCLCASTGKYTATVNSDCNDNNAAINPNATEICGNGIDDNCDGSQNAENAIGCTIFYKDADHDNYGVASDTKCYCSGSGSYTATQDSDCNDANPNVNPGKTEICNGIDDNCNGLIDENADTICGIGNMCISGLCNHPPVLAAIGNKLVAEGATLTFVISGNDIDGNSLNYGASNLPLGAVFNTATKTFSWTPDYDQSGTYTKVHFEVSDGYFTDDENITITVTNTNRAPIFDDLTETTQHVNENELIEFFVYAIDPDDDPVIYTIDGLPTGSTYNLVTHMFSWTPEYDQAGTYIINFVASDGSLSTTKTITIYVHNINRAPVLDAIPDQTTSEGTLLTVNVFALDPDEDILTFSLQGTVPAGMSINPTSGRISWTPNYEQAGDHTITVRASDYGLYDEKSFNIHVDNTNRAPVLSPIGNKLVNEGSLLQFTITASDPDGDTLTYSADNLPSGATFDFTTHIFTWTPDYDQNGVYTNVRFEVTDGSLTAAQNITITVLNTNRNPMIESTPIITATELTPYYYDVEAMDPDDDPLTYSLDIKPTGMTINSTTGLISWIPQDAHAKLGNNRVVVRVSDGQGGIATQDFQIFVTDINQNPQITSTPITIATEVSPYIYDVNAIDPDAGDILTYALTAAPAGMTINNVTGLITWTPTDEDARNSPAAVTVEVTDNHGGSASQAFEITITNINQAPHFTSTPVITAKETVLYTYDADAVDPDLGDALTYSLLTAPAGMTIDPVSGLITWTPDYTQYGNRNVVVKVTDSGIPVLSATQSFTIAVENTNRLPSLNPIGDKTVNENSTLQFTILGTDPDADDTLTYSASNLPTGAVFNPATKTFAWTPTFDQAGTYPDVQFTVKDNWNGSASESITITVFNVNRAPVLAHIGNKYGAENSLLNFTISAVDPDGDSVSYSSSPLPTGASLNMLTGEFAWIPTFDQAGDYQVTFRAADANLSNNETINIHIANTNRAPIMNPIPDQSLWENETVSFTVSASDPDGDVLGYSASNLPSGAVFDAVTRTFTWKPNFMQSGIYTVTFTATDPYGASDSKDALITVKETGNHAPELMPIGDKTITEGQLLVFTVNAIDVDGDSLLYSAEGLPAGAEFNTATKTFSWTPSYVQSGNYMVTFSVNDGILSDSETITINVLEAGNQPPILEPIPPKFVTEGSLLEFTVTATDPDMDPITYSAENIPDGATFNTVTMTFSWTPSFWQSGSYDVTFKASDGSLEDSEIAHITVLEFGNHPPVLEPVGDKSLIEGELLEFTISATDEDHDPLIYSALGLPAGAVFNPTTQTFTWTPSFTQSGVYSVTFKVFDGKAYDSETISITVGNSANHAPELAPIGNKELTEGQLLTFTVSAIDVDGDTLTYSAQNLPAGATFNSATQTFTWTPNYLQSEIYTVTFMVSDGSLMDSETISITVNEAGNQPPVLELIGDKNVYEEQILEFIINATDPDNSSDQLTYSAFGLPTGAEFDPQTRKFSWTPVREQIGTYKVTFAVSDGALEDSETITINVLETPYESLFVRSIRMDEIVNAGEQLNVFVTLKDDGTKDMKGIKITVLIPDLGIIRSVGPFSVKQGQDISKQITLDIPADTVPGKYDVRITMNNDEERRVKYREVTIV